MLVVEDMVDKGATLTRIRERLGDGASSLRVCVLLYRRRNAPSRQLFEFNALEDNSPDFVVGYGIDHNERFRELPYITELSNALALRQEAS